MSPATNVAIGFGYPRHESGQITVELSSDGLEYREEEHSWILTVSEITNDIPSELADKHEIHVPRENVLFVAHGEL